ncbi:hypothetical protein [Streptomyces sp. NBC_00445]|uniref:hypothetical protein n=1 Tax=Streptomyces sp. NBC_00445 TaxID=2975745 RepID=UPI002E200E76
MEGEAGADGDAAGLEGEASALEGDVAEASGAAELGAGRLRLAAGAGGQRMVTSREPDGPRRRFFAAAASTRRTPSPSSVRSAATRRMCPAGMSRTTETGAEVAYCFME